MRGTGLKAVLLCTPDSLPIHIYGFNWHGRMWQGHKVIWLSAHRQPYLAAHLCQALLKPCFAYGFQGCT